MLRSKVGYITWISGKLKVAFAMLACQGEKKEVVEVVLSTWEMDEHDIESAGSWGKSFLKLISREKRMKTCIFFFDCHRYDFSCIRSRHR